LEALAKKLQGKVQFAFVYTQEIHPNQPMDALPGSPVELLPALSSTRNRAEREQRASEFCRSMKGGIRRILVDEDGDGKGGHTRVQCLYHMKSIGGRNFEIDRDRRVAATGTIDLLEKQLLEAFPDLASDLHEDDANHFSIDLPADGG
jgi:hypothetical protein